MKQQNHPNLESIHSYLEDDKKIYVISCLNRGIPLVEKLAQQKGYNENLIVDIAYQIMLGLSYMHSNKHMHGDLSIDKIMATKIQSSFDIDVFISDIGFGSRSKNIKPNNVMNMSPELVMRENCSEKCDMWSLGCIVYQLLVGKSPFENKTFKLIKTDILYKEITFKEAEWKLIS